METLPPEVLHEIFRLACSDGGRTGCVLATVSRYTRNASHPFRFYSIAVSGTDQLIQFSTRLSQGGPNPPIYHLFISGERHNGRPRWTPRAEIAEGAPPSALQQAHRTHKALCSACLRIIAYAARTLRTLTVVTRVLYFQDLTDFPWPRLRELAIGFAPVRSTPPLSVTAHLTTCMPVLARLNLIVAEPSHFTIPNLLGTAPQNFPQLTHLRFSGFEQVPYFVEDLAIALGRDVYTPYACTRLAGFLPALPDSIEHVFIHAAREFADPRSLHPRSWRDMMADLRSMAADGLIVLTEGEREENHALDIFLAFKDWKSRLNGGNGSWGTAKRGATR